MKNKEIILLDLTQEQTEQVSGGVNGEIVDPYGLRSAEDTKGGGGNQQMF
ncbi:MAG: hypothetical protein ACREO8_11910 [Luteimonas sp.]